ncbi:universal stress protein [Hoeflea prorocentri]|uniref:Universal stress protein n=1 Tax=Hoeflea prorocentri TaxID=1922333 RepID=A0A9X3ULI6_9HYPH|nr:universal stress protein [Hoeflea prorocentri]MCY6382625.1 universal stress protein [Hoeflea prorocentri]MDA5400425.1 universal stress protein [Hoeflea prorocentri]
MSSTNIFKRVLATIDLGDEVSSVKVVEAALEVMVAEDTLFAVCVVPDYGRSIVGTFFPADHEKQLIEHATEELHAFTAKHVPKGTRVQHVIAHGSIYEEIMAAADQCEADLIVVGSHRPALKDYLLGPNASRVVRHAKQSVLVVRH